MKLRQLILCSLLGMSLLPKLSAQTKILPLGDSITSGQVTWDSYRRQLWHLLAQNGYAVDFIGSMHGNPGGNPPHPDFDLDHEGHPRIRADEIYASLATWLPAYTPDIVLLLIGTNDAIQNEGGASYLPKTISDIQQIILRLRADNPRVVVLLGKVLPLVENWTIPEPIDYNVSERIDALNANIPGIAAGLNTAASPVVVVDLVTGFNPAIGQDTFDGVHPNLSGEAKVATKFYQALVPFLTKPSQPTQPPVTPGTFYRAINVGGSAAVIDGRQWEGNNAGNYGASGSLYTYPSFLFSPAVDTARSGMLRSFVFGNNVQVALSAVPTSEYDVYVWTFEDNAAINATISVQGKAVANYRSGVAGSWSRLGPYRAAVTDGMIRVGLTTSVDQGLISGLEVWRIGTVSTPAPPSVPAAPVPVLTGTLYRGINVGGSALVVNGESWEGQNAANYAFSGAFYTYPSFTFNPSLDAARADVLRSYIYGNNVQLALGATPTGAYDVYIWTFEDSSPLVAQFSVQGQVVGNYQSGAPGKWDRLGPFRANVTDGVIRVGLKTTSDLGVISGLEVRRASGTVTSPAPAATFYRGINVGGSPVVVDGNSWEGQGAPSYSATGTFYTYPTFNFNPAVDAGKSAVLRSFVYGNNVQLAVGAIPTGSYRVYIWTFEDNNPLSAQLTVQGASVGTYTSGPAGKWDRLGPYPVTITNGLLNIGLRTTTDLGVISGVEIWKVPAG